jgi:hypothetical protein
MLREGKDLSMYKRGKFHGPTSKSEVGCIHYGTWRAVEAAKEKAAIGDTK